MADLDPSDLILMFLFDRTSNFSKAHIWAMGMANVERQKDIKSAISGHQMKYLDNCNHDHDHHQMISSTEIVIYAIVAVDMFMIIATKLNPFILRKMLSNVLIVCKQKS